MKPFYFILFISIILSACENSNSEKIKITEYENDISIFDAKLFKINQSIGYKILSIFDKKGKLKDTYYLIGRDELINDSIKDMNVIRTPVKNIVCLSTTHIAFVDMLDETDKITAISGSQYVYNKNLRTRILNNEVKDVGYENALDFELLLKLKPDVVTVYDINGTISPIINKIKKFNIPVIQINEYMESSLLSQAEWLKFFGELFNKRTIANDKFKEVKQNYSNLLKMTDTITDRPKILLNMPWKGTWYIPGGDSNIAQLIEDAGGDYIWKDLDERHNIPLNIEDVYLKARNADIWLNTGQASSIDDIINTDSRLKDFKPVKGGNIFNRINKLSESGANDYMESGTVRPDLILKDMIKILHPHLLPDHEFYFYKKLY